MQAKKELRQHFQTVRSGVTEAFATLASEHASSLLEKSPIFKAANHIAIYFSDTHEFHTKALLQLIFKHKKHCYLPVLTEDKTMLFAAYHQDDPLQKNIFNISEPLNAPVKILAEQLDLVIVPLLAFTPSGDRLGRGGGYYDRTFAFKYTDVTRKPFLLGLGYQLQETPELIKDAWDIKLNGALTEKQLLICTDQ